MSILYLSSGPEAQTANAQSMRVITANRGIPFSKDSNIIAIAFKAILNIITLRNPSFSLERATQLPPNAGKIVSVEWDLDGSGKFATKENKVALNKNGVFKLSHSNTKPGIYFPTVRIASERNGDANTPFARIQNLDRVRVIIK